MDKKNDQSETRCDDLEKRLRESERKAAYYQKLTEEIGSARLRENEMLSKMLAEQKLMENALQQHNKYMEALHETSLGLIKRRNISELLETVTAHVTALIDGSHGFIYIYDSDAGELEFRVGLGRFQKAVGFRLRPREGLAWQAWETGRPVIVDDYGTWEGKIGGDLFEGLRACIVVPLRSGAGTIGLGYFDEERRQFGTNEIDILTRFAELASIVLENAKLWEELQHAKDAAEAASRAKTEFIRNISHKLRTPLTAIMGHSQLMSGSPELSPEHRNQAAIIHSRGEHLLTLINKVIELSRDGPGGTDLNHRNFDLDDLLENMQADTSDKYGRMETETATSRLQALPQEWTEALRNAANRTSPKDANEAVRQIEEQDEELAKYLTELVRTYRFDIIQKLFDEV